MNKRLIMLIIMDGLGYSPETKGNAVYAARKPNLEKIFSQWDHTLIGASGMSVGLPEGQMGNSEVGHTNIGAGRIVYQEFTRITKSIKDGDFYTNEELTAAMENCIKNDRTLHLIGLVSDGGVHSHNTHLYALLDMAKKKGVKNVFVHCLMDGRDVSPTSGIEFIKELEGEMEKIGVGKIATIAGRYYGMDRDNRWDRIEKVYSAIVYGEGKKESSAVECMRKSYESGVTDEFVIPTVIDESGTVKPNDSVIFFNFRPDRARQLTRSFVDENFTGFEKGRYGFFPLYYVCMTQYDAKMPNVHVAFKPESLTNTLGEYISRLGYKQLRIAETEKYAHVTFFFNGGVEKVFEGEDRVLIPSPKVATYDLKPEMSAYEVTDEVLRRIEYGKYDSIILNYANCDMVGHTGVFECAKKAVETVDECVGKVVEAVLKQGGVALITADHGNAEQMIDPVDGSPFTAHTTNPVPFVIVGERVKLREGGVLADIAPTVLELMGLEKPKEMKGTSLIAK